MCTKHCWTYGINGTKMLQTLLSDEAVICSTELELSTTHFHSYMQICKMVNQQQKGNRHEGSVEGIVTEIS
jgi:hypothetical protein